MESTRSKPATTPTSGRDGTDAGVERVPELVAEDERLAELRRLGVLDTPPEERFDRIVRLAAASLATPIALVSLIDERRQWFKARVGLDATETPREQAFCARAILHPGAEPFVVRDATQDPRFAQNPLVTGEPHIRFYAGAVLHGPGGQPLGTLCAIDRAPRSLDGRQAQILRDLADLVEHELVKTARDDVVAELERSQRSNATLIESLRDALVVQDTAGRIVRWNANASRLLGLTDDELGGRTSFDPRWRAVHADGRPWPGEEHPAIETLRTGRAVTDRMMGVHRPDGSLVWLSVNSRPIEDEAGNVTSVLTLFSDVAERFEAERASEAMALRLRQAIEASGIGTAILGSDGSTVFVNEAYCEIVGMRADELLGRTHEVWMRPHAIDAEGSRFTLRALEGEVRATADIQLADHAGPDRWVRAHLSRLDDGSSADRFVLQLQEITEQRRLEQELRHDQQVSSASLDALEQGVVLADATGAIHRINPAAERILGYSAAELTEVFRSGRWETYDEHGRVLPPEQRPLRRVIDEGVAVRSEIVGWRHRSGHLVLLRLSCVPLPHGTGEPDRFVVGFADVSHQRRAEQLLDATFAMAPVGLALVDRHRKVVRSNAAFEIHAGSQDRSRRILDAAASGDASDGHAGEGALGQELHFPGTDDSEGWIEMRRSHIDDLEHPLDIVATFDVTARKRLEVDLARFSHLFRHASDIITVVDETGQVQYASPSNERVLGYPDGWRSPNGVLDMVHPDDVGDALTEFESLLRGNRTPEPFRMRVRTYDGSWKWIETLGTNLIDEPSVRGIVLTSRDVTEGQLLSDELAHRATHDPLTDLPNRAVVADRLGAALSRSIRQDAPVGLCYLDLDHFKQVNDTLGHAAGDRILVEVARRLAGAVRGSDLAARVGGDEFVVVLDLVVDAENALTIAQRIQGQLTRPRLQIDGQTVGVTMGVTVSEIDDTPSSLLTRADAALYAAKARRRGSIEFRAPAPAVPD